MKKIVCVLLASALFLSVLVQGCSGKTGGYTYKNIPSDLPVKPSLLSEGELQTKTEDYDAEKFPLVASVPEDDMWFYDINMAGKYGVLIKHAKTIYYYNWEYFRRSSFPEVYSYDYDGDGHKELAVSLKVDDGALNYQENLYIVDFDDPSFTIYSSGTLEAQAGACVTVEKDGKTGRYYLVDDNSKKKFELDFTGMKGDLIGTTLDYVQNFTLGEKITGMADIGFLFGNEGEPMFQNFAAEVDVEYADQTCNGVNARIVRGSGKK
ncbi:MAG: hypothetical protein K6F09_00210 [Clostridiales bacterium]|nr:hypothetical protein [Clostridiales bacterium]